MSDLEEENKKLKDRIVFLCEVIEGLRISFRDMMIEVSDLKQQIMKNKLP